MSANDLPATSLIKLVVGLGNPGPLYAKTRHNAGFWFTERLLGDQFKKLTPHSEFRGLMNKIKLFNQDLFFLLPLTYMNNSGQSVVTIAKYYKIPPEAILVVHDELDLPPGIIRFKIGGGVAGHKGLASIGAHLNTHQFVRCRIGIGRPVSSHHQEISDYVLHPPSKEERVKIDEAIDRAIQVFPLVITGNLEQAMNVLH